MKKLIAFLFIFIIFITGCSNKETEVIEPIPEPVIEEVKPMIAFTFDDGPSNDTMRLLDALEEHDSHATFFVLGYRISKFPKTLQRAVELDMEIASHTWNHRNMRSLNETEIRNTLTRTNNAIEQITGTNPNIYRPPFGMTNPKVRNISEDLGLSIVNWSLDGMDWRYKDANRVFNIVMNRVKENDIILLHDIHPTTVDAMEKLIPALIERGFKLVTVSELLLHLHDELEPGSIYGRVNEPN